MKSKELLFELIHSLTKSEKRFVKLNAQLHGGNKVYLKLLDAIMKQKEYNEEELKSVFDGEDFTKQFSVAKNYLQNFILKQLRQYHSGLKVNIECKNLLIDIEILFWKGQYKLAEKLIAKTEKIANKYELFLILEELNYWNERIHSALLKLDQSGVKNTTEKHQNNLSKYQNIIDYNELRNEVQLLIKESETIRDKSELKRYQKLINHPLLKDMNNAQSFYAKYSYFVLNGVINSVVGNVNEAKRYQNNLLKYIEGNKQFIEENIILYTAVIHNLIKEALIENDFERFDVYLDTLKKLDLKMPHEKANVFSKLCLFELRYYIQHNQLEKAKYFIENTVKEYTGLNSILNKQHEYLLNYQTTLVYFLLGDNHGALKWINKLINEPSKNLRVDIRCRAYMLNIIIHFERENMELIPYLVKTTLNYLRSIKTLRKTDEFFITMFNSIPLASNKRELVRFLTQKKVEISKIKSKSIMVEESDYLDWMESKIQNTSVSAIVAQRI